MRIQRWALWIVVVLQFSNIAAQHNDGYDIAVQELKARQATFGTEKKNQSAAQSQYDVHYYQLDVEIDPNKRFIKGNSTTHFVVLESLNSIELDLASVLTVDSVKFNNQLVSVSGIGKDKIKVFLPQNLPVGTFGAVTVWYKGTPPNNGFNAFDQRTHQGAPIIWTFSCPDNADDWWACKNTLDDKADSVEIIVKNPIAYTAVANGKLYKTEQVGNQTISYWKHRYPITTYLIAVAVTNYAVYSDFLVQGQDSLEILNYVYPENLVQAKAGTAALLPVMQFYEEKFGPYPYRKERFGHAQFSWGGGMEHQTTAFVTDFSKGLLAHELSHQWFGDMVTCGSFTEAWLNEGFATYVTALVDETTAPNTFRSWRSSTINSVTSVINGSLYCKDTTNANRIYDYRLTYQKGAMVLHMLRWIVGDSAFFKGVRNYLEDPKLKYKYVTTNDLMNHLEKSSGKDLKPFFQKWFYGEGHPKYELRWNQGNDFAIKAVLNQTTSHNSVAFYDLPVEIRFTGSLDGNVKDTTLLLQHDKTGFSFQFNPGYKISIVTIDPNLWLIAKKTVIKDATLSSQTLDEAAIVTVQPNPFTQQFTLSSDQNILSVSVYDFEGRLVLQKNTDAHEVQLDMSAYQSGNYVLLTKTKSSTWSQKIVKK